MENVFQTYDLKQWQVFLEKRYADHDHADLFKGRIYRIVEMFLEPLLKRYKESPHVDKTPDNNYERIRCLTSYAIGVRTVLGTFWYNRDPKEIERSVTKLKQPSQIDTVFQENRSHLHDDHRAFRDQAYRDLFQDDALLVEHMLRPYPFGNRQDLLSVMMRIAYLESEKASGFLLDCGELERLSLLRHFNLALVDSCAYVSLDYNQLSKLGLVYKINKEVLHPLGLALHYNVEDGVSEGVYISPDRTYEYREDTIREEEEKLQFFLKHRAMVLDALELFSEQ